MTEIMSSNQKLFKFFKSKGHNSAENHSTRTKFTLDLRIFKMHLHSEFQLKMLIYDRANERKLKNYWNFSKSKGHNSAKNYSTEPKFDLNLCIVLTHLCTKFQIKMSICNGDNEQTLKIIVMEFSKLKGHNSAEN